MADNLATPPERSISGGRTADTVATRIARRLLHTPEIYEHDRLFTVEDGLEQAHDAHRHG